MPSLSPSVLEVGILWRCFPHNNSVPIIVMVWLPLRQKVNRMKPFWTLEQDGESDCIMFLIPIEAPWLVFASLELTMTIGHKHSGLLLKKVKSENLNSVKVTNIMYSFSLGACMLTYDHFLIFMFVGNLSSLYGIV